ncbi:uncharacterized protein [Henckelia pumila]|uniref:uncharacterized protein n=1 Tax=Henckelia pumila TaxID=405737 RepID=UPI003C6DFCD2
MGVGNGQTAKSCGICASMGHATDMCPTLQEESIEQVNATGGFPGPPQWKYDLYSNTYNPGWKDHPNLRYGNLLANQPGPQAQPHNQAYRPPYPPQQQRPQIPATASIQNLNNQMGQLATAINKLEAQHSNALPSQTIPNPMENASVITLRNGKELKVKEKLVDAFSKKEQNEELKVDDKEATQGEAQKGTSLCEVFEVIVHCKEKTDIEGMSEDRVGGKCICCDPKEIACKIQRSSDDCVFSVDIVDYLVQECFEHTGKDELEVATIAPSQQDDDGIGFNEEVEEIVTILNRAPELPQSVIISRSLEAEQEEQLVNVLKEHKSAIGWTIADIKGISPSTCMHRILMQEGANPLRQPQRKLNPPMMEVVKAEILKLLEVGIAIAPEDQDKTTFTCPFGTFAYRRFYRRYIQDFAKIASPMCKLLQKDVTFEFDESCKTSFDKHKDSLTLAPIIQPPYWSKPFEIMCDASDYALGAVLRQRVGKSSHAIYYASHILNDAQRNYSTTEKELLPVVFA